MSGNLQQYIRKLQRSEARFRTIIARNADAIVIVDRGGIIRFVNPAAETLFGHSSEELCGQLFGFPISSGNTVELDIVHAGKRIAIAEMHVVETEWKGKTAYLASLRDITAHKNIEQLEQDRNRILELIVRHESLETILQQIALLVERQYTDTHCTLLLLREGRLHFVGTAPSPLSPSKTATMLPVSAHGCACSQSAYFKERVVEQVHTCQYPTCQVCTTLPDTSGFDQCYALPLLSPHRDIVGILALHYPSDSNNCASSDEHLLNIARHLATIAIEQWSLTQQLIHQAHHDVLTDLPNRKLFESRLNTAIAEAERYKRQIAVFFIDLDRFKQINDTLGHATGDVLIQQVVRRLKSELRTYDTLARMGGDEFMLFLNDIHTPQMIASVARKLLDTLHTPFEIDGRELFVTASIGISLYPEDGRTVATLQQNADVAMYRAKESGGNSFQCFNTDMNTQALERLEMHTELRRALEREELELYYQPQVDQKGKLVGAEALLRWNHPRLGTILPSTFVPLAEESGLIVPIGTWVLHEACRQNNAWRRAGYPSLKVAVNVSSVQFAQPDFTEIVADALKHYTRSIPHLELEITESVLILDFQDVAHKLTRLQEIGVRVAIDDFGTGYSSLVCLQRLPINTLKIDQSFVQSIGNQTHTSFNDTAIVGAITMLAHNLGLKVVAEGVETESQFRFVCDIGCREAQGYLFGRAMPAHEFETLLQHSLNGYQQGYLATV